MEQWFIVPVNPYPWKVPPISVGRKNGKAFPRVGRDEGLHSFKEAVKDYVLMQGPQKINGPVELRLWFWRNIPEYTTSQGRTARKHEADNTNLQKATEDALQGILFNNDKDVIINRSVRMMQSKDSASFLVIHAKAAKSLNEKFPDFVQEKIDMLVHPQYDGRLATLFDEME